MASSESEADRIFIGHKGKTYRIEAAINIDRRICIRMYNRRGNQATARFWVWEYFGLKKKKLGTHTGKACFNASGPTYNLKVGHLESTTYFYVFYGKPEIYYSLKFDIDDFL